MISPSTLNQIIKAILDESDNYSPGNREIVANEAAIYYKTAMICEDKGIDKAMEYFKGVHNEDEYQELSGGENGKAFLYKLDKEGWSEI